MHFYDYLNDYVINANRQELPAKANEWRLAHQGRRQTRTRWLQLRWPDRLNISLLPAHLRWQLGGLLIAIGCKVQTPPRVEQCPAEFR